MIKLTQDSNDLTFCPICKAKQIRDGSSLHGWDIEYECGCVLMGAIGDADIYIDKPCLAIKK
jgi:hypothetical protein